MYRSDYQFEIFLQIGNASAAMTDCARSQVTVMLFPRSQAKSARKRLISRSLMSGTPESPPQSTGAIASIMPLVPSQQSLAAYDVTCPEDQMMKMSPWLTAPSSSRSYKVSSIALLVAGFIFFPSPLSRRR
jgi:hypothetical protein